MNSKTAQMQIRLDPKLKKEAEGLLEQLGLSPTEFVRMALRQLVMKKEIPFETRIPNAETIAAMNEDISKYKRYSSAKELIEDLHAQLKD